ncbi:MAG: type II CAAX endopeptidase family protein [Eubacteriales bacterium]|nr:type II CAAX endopeptidase family protein [Eubacteriales bacterium]
MENTNCPCKKKNCERHGNCDDCRKHHDDSKKQRPVACEMAQGKPVFKDIILILICLTVIQSFFLGTKRIVFIYITETFYSRSIVTLISMIVVFAVTILYSRRKKYSLSVFPQTFSLPYIVITLIAAGFYVFTLFFVKTFTLQNALILLYGSIVTPILEELLFRGVIWNKLNKCFDKEWKTFLTVTVLFALWHIGYAIGIYLWNGGNLLNVIMMKVITGAIFGAMLGSLRYKTKNCYSGILVHGILNVLG